MRASKKRGKVVAITEYVQLSDSPSVWVLSSANLSPFRLDASYYSPCYLDSANKLQSLPYDVSPFESLCTKLNCGSTPKQVVYGKQGMPLIRTGNVRPNHYDDSDTLRVSDLRLSSESNRAILPGDILYTMSGSVGYTAVYPGWGEIASCSNTIARGRLRDTKMSDPYFITLFLNSSLGLAQSKRLVSGGVLAHVMPNSVKKLLIAKPDSEIQRAIGNKIRKAERLRELAQASWNEANTMLAMTLGIALESSYFEHFDERSLTRNGYTCVSINPAMVYAHAEEQLGAQYYHPRRVNARNVASRSGTAQPLSQLADRVRKTASHPNFIGLDRIDSVTGVIAGGDLACEDATGVTFRRNDILFSRLRPYLNKVAIWRNGEAVGSTELVIYRSNSDCDPHYLFFVLKSALGLYQVIDVTSGSTHPRVDEDVIDDILIPRLDQAAEKEIARMVAQAFDNWYEASELIPKAKADVEALIDGSLDENALLTEGNQIEQWLTENPGPALSKGGRHQCQS